MKSTVAVLLCVLTFGTIVMPCASRAQSANQVAGIAVEVHGFRNNNGMLGCSLFNGPQGFPRNRSKVMLKRTAPIENGQAECIFDGVTAGTYAVTIFHDENGNHKFDTNLIGMPLEGYGFSNNVKPTISAPSFDQSKFPYDGVGLKKISIDMIYR